MVRLPVGICLTADLFFIATRQGEDRHYTFRPVIEAELVDPDLDLFVNEGGAAVLYAQRGGLWHVSEGRTGHLITSGRTRAEAIVSAYDKIGRSLRNREQFYYFIFRAVVKYGLSPRWEFVYSDDERECSKSGECPFSVIEKTGLWARSG